MKTLLKWMIYTGALLMMIILSCEREHMPPPSQMPQYEWPPANVTIAEIKARYASVNTVPSRITEPWILRAVVTSSDLSGNIFQQVYL